MTDVPSWDVTVNADRASALTSARIDLPDGEHLVIHAWPEDPSWRRDVTELLSTGLPKLVEETGLDVAGGRRPRGLRGPHAAARGLRRDLLRGREPDRDQRGPRRPDDPPRGVARLVQRRPVRRALDQRGVRRHVRVADARRDRARRLGARTPSTRRSAAAVRLNDWTFPGRIADDQTDAHEAYGYDAAWTVVRTIASELGPDRMRAVLAAAEAHQIAYAGAGTPETVAGRTDWRRLLDLFDERGGSRTADDVFRRWVVNDAQRADLDARADRPDRLRRARRRGRRLAAADVRPRRDERLGLRRGGLPDRRRAGRPRAARRARPGRVGAGVTRRRPTCGPPTRRRRTAWRRRRRSRRARSRRAGGGRGRDGRRGAARPVRDHRAAGATTPEAAARGDPRRVQPRRRDDGDRRRGPVRGAGRVRPASGASGSSSSR